MICPDCEEDKSLESFGKARWRKSGYSYRCKNCNARRASEWGRLNPEKIKIHNAKSYKKWREQNPLLPRIELVTENGRFCRTCGIRKPEDEFGKDARSKNGRAWLCKQCARERHRRWTEANREHVRDAARGSVRRQRQRNSDKYLDISKWSRIRKKYGLSSQQVLAMLEAQDGRCAICKKEILITRDRINNCAVQVDHDHATGKVRGLLCAPCNTALGKFKDSIGMLQCAIAYLQQYEK